MVFKCLTCLESLDSTEPVVSLRRERLDQREPDTGYGHAHHERDAMALGYRVVGRGTVGSLERERNPNLG